MLPKVGDLVQVCRYGAWNGTVGVVIGSDYSRRAVFVRVTHNRGIVKFLLKDLVVLVNHFSLFIDQSEFDFHPHPGLSLE